MDYDQQIEDIVSDLTDMRSEYHLTTSGYTKVKPFPPGPGTHWGKGEAWYGAAAAKLEQLREALKPEPEPGPPPAGAKNNLMVVRIGSNSVPTGGDLTRYGYVAMNPWEHAKGKQLRDAGAVTLAYKCMASSREGQAADTAGGVRYDTADAAWFALKGGQRFKWASFSGHWQMDIGSPAYQAAWVEQVLENLDSHEGSWSGVLVDNANMEPGSDYALLPYDLYPTWQSYRDATRDFLAEVAPKIRAAGYLFIPNIQHHGSLSRFNEALFRDWIQFTDGGAIEGYTKWGGTTGQHITGAGWETSGQCHLRAAQEMGKVFVGTFRCPTSDARSMNYARASFLMEWDGGPSALNYEPEPLAADPWSPVWTRDVGLPKGPKYAIASGWRRDFVGGYVTVNPDTAEGVVA